MRNEFAFADRTMAIAGFPLQDYIADAGPDSASFCDESSSELLSERRSIIDGTSATGGVRC